MSTQMIYNVALPSMIWDCRVCVCVCGQHSSSVTTSVGEGDVVLPFFDRFQCRCAAGFVCAHLRSPLYFFLAVRRFGILGGRVGWA